MNEDSLRLVRPGLPQSVDPRKPAFFLVMLMLLSISNPVAADTSISRDDFDVIDALMETLTDRIQGWRARYCPQFSTRGSSTGRRQRARHLAERPTGGIKLIFRWNHDARFITISTGPPTAIRVFDGCLNSTRWISKQSL